MASAFLLLLTATCGTALREVFQNYGAIDLLHIQMHASGKQEKLSKSKVSDDMINASGKMEATPDVESFLQRSSSKFQRELSQLLHQSSHGVAGVDEASNFSSSLIFSSMSTSTSSFISSSSFSSSSSSPSLSLHHACDTSVNPFASKGKEDSCPCPGTIITGSQGKYQYIESLAKGTFGEVWSVTKDLTGASGKSSAFSCACVQKAFKRKPEPTAVVKRSLKMASRMESLEKSMARGEVCAMAKCKDSPYVAKISDSFQKGDHYYIVMEFVPGRTLESHIKKKTFSLQRTPHELALIFYDILRGLDYIHNKGISHRDIKPENVLITPNNRAKLVDFGLASDSTTVKTEVVGSFYYFPPEIAAASPYFGPEVDAFSLGATLYEMVTGEPAYSERHFPKAKTAYFPTSHHMKLLSDVPEQIKKIIFCTQKEQIGCSDLAKCRCGISDIMQMSWIQEAALDPRAHA